jgi:hypothetical protein
MRIKMHLVEVSQTHVKADGCQHDHGSLADGNWQKLASDSADIHNFSQGWFMLVLCFRKGPNTRQTAEVQERC